MSKASTARHAKRSTKRFMNDVYGRGTVRMCVEAVNLLTMRRPHDSTAAESLKSNSLVPFPCQEYIACQQAAVGEESTPASYQSLEIDNRNPNQKK